MGARTRVRWLIAVAVACTMCVATSAQAGPGDDAHVITTQANGITNTSELPLFLTCPAGERVLGGGMRPTPTQSGSILIDNGPFKTGAFFLENGDVPSEWFSHVRNLSGKVQNYVGHAVCSASTDAITRFADFATPANGAASEASNTVTCNAGERAIGGGVISKTGRPISIEATMPLSAAGTIDSLNDNDVARSWYVNVRADNQILRAYAICSATSQATIQVETVFFAGSGYHLNLHVPCPTGQRALSGGLGSMQPNITPAIQANMPGNSTGSNLPTNGTVAGGWFGRIAHLGSGPASYRVAAICEGPTPGTTPDPPDPPDPTDPNPVDPLNPTIVPPSNDFKFGRFFRHPDRGIGALVLKVPGPGEVVLSSSKLKPQANVATEAGEVGLSILAAKGQPKKKLQRTGKLKAKLKVTYTPDSGTPNTEKTKLKLKLDRD